MTLNTVTIGPLAQCEIMEFWRLAVESTSNIKEQIKNKDYLGFWMSFKGEAQTVKQVKFREIKQERESRMAMLYTTTYGEWEFLSEADDVIKMEAMFSSSSIHRAGPVINQQLVTVNGKLFWSIAYSQRVISCKTARKYADTMFNIIHKAIEQ